ncbi:MAG: hypothetical protein ACREOZ_00185 [Gloeomargaritales cyanobacterium]
MKKDCGRIITKLLPACRVLQILAERFGIRMLTASKSQISKGDVEEDLPGEGTAPLASETTSASSAVLSRFKTYQEAKRTQSVTASCSSVKESISYLFQAFFGAIVPFGCGGSY